MPTLSDPVRACARRKSALRPATCKMPTVKAWSALVLSVLQIALLFVAPVSACCVRDDRAVRSQMSAEVECCPPGSHPPGQCPLHKSRAVGRGEQSAPCRMRCDAQRPDDVLPVAIGVLPPPRTRFLPPARSLPFDEVMTAGAVSQRPLPDAPPPKSLS
jgi:hypothetical protein